MTPASDYSRSFILQVRSVTKNTTTGQDVESFTAGGYLWGAIDTTADSESTAYGATQSQSRAVIRFRMYPTISALDRLVDVRYGDTYVIDGVRRGTLETICDATKFDDLDLEDQ